jgi:regulatory protein YycH of two-component signal transduction system YycFG
MIERLKTTLLTLLVLLSIFLTWKLWTYQPNYDHVAEEPQYLEDISIGKKLELIDVFQPTKMIFHLREQHFGTEKTSKIASIYRDMQNWNLQSFYSLPDRLTNMKELTSINESVEIIFPAPLSADIIRFIFKLSEEQFSLEGVDRIVLSANVNTGKDETIAHFISLREQKVIEAEINNVPYSAIIENYLLDAHVQTPYYKYEFPAFKGYNKIIYLADAKQTLKAVTYTASKLRAEEQFKDVLFSDPQFVRKTQAGTEESTYTDGKRALEFSHELSMMKYINPVQKHGSLGTQAKGILQSYHFINAHSGWTDRYLYYKWEEEKEAVTFRQYINNYPVFSKQLIRKKNDMSTIYVSWREGQVHEYIRSLIDIERELIENGEVQLAKGSKIIDYLQYLEEMKEFNPLLLKDITIGYEMTVINTNLIFLKPSWFIYYSGEWQALNYEPQDEEEEDSSGLE